MNNVPEAMDRVHLSPRKAIARRLAKSGAVLRSGEALEIPTRRADAKRRICDIRGVSVPPSRNKSIPWYERPSSMTGGPKTSQTIVVIVTIVIETAVVEGAWLKPRRTQI
jgi:hypothetical protein